MVWPMVIENIVTLICATSLSIFLVWFTGSLWGLLGLVLLCNINYFKQREHGTSRSSQTAKGGVL